MPFSLVPFPFCYILMSLLDRSFQVKRNSGLTIEKIIQLRLNNRDMLSLNLTMMLDLIKQLYPNLSFLSYFEVKLSELLFLRLN